MSNHKGKNNLRIASLTIVGVVVLCALIMGISLINVRDIENKLEQMITQKLSQAGFNIPEMSFDGRDVILLGDVDAIEDRAKMVDIIREIPGINSVKDQRTVLNYTVARHFTLNSYAGITTVEGELPSKDDVLLIENAIQDHYGVDPLGANLRITRSVQRPPWLDKFSDILTILSDISPLEIDYANNTLRVSGVAPDRATKKRVTQLLSSVLDPGITLDSRLKIKVSGKASTLKFQFKDGKAVIYGTVPDQEFIDSIIQNIRLAFATNVIDNQLKVDQEVDEGSWLDATLRMVFPLAITTWVDLDVTENKILLQGEVKGDAELEIINDQVEENFGYDTRVINKVEKKASL